MSGEETVGLGDHPTIPDNYQILFAQKMKYFILKPNHFLFPGFVSTIEK